MPATDNLKFLITPRLAETKDMVRRKNRKSAPDDAVLELTTDNFDAVLSSNDRLVVDFWGTHCIPCRRVHPMIDSLARKYYGTIAFGKLNADENVEVAVKYGVMSVPTVLVFRNGKKVGEMRKIASAEHLESFILEKLEV